MPFSLKVDNSPAAVCRGASINTGSARSKILFSGRHDPGTGREDDTVLRTIAQRQSGGNAAACIFAGPFG